MSGHQRAERKKEEGRREGGCLSPRLSVTSVQTLTLSFTDDRLPEASSASQYKDKTYFS